LRSEVEQQIGLDYTSICSIAQIILHVIISLKPHILIDIFLVEF
jgi:hypothetical protein